MCTRRLSLIIIFALLVPAVALFAGGGRETKEVVLSWPTIWVGQDSKAAVVAELVEEFNAAHAGCYRVDIEPNPDYDGYRDKINASIAAGEVPDLFVFNPDPTTFQYYEGDLLFDFGDELNGPWGSSFVEGTIDGATRNGATKSVPYELALTPIWYNADLLTEAGVDRFPTTINEFYAAGDRLKAAGVAPTSQMTGGSNAWTSMLWYSHILASIGGQDVWSRPLSHPQYVQAAEIMQRLFQDYTTRDAVGADAGVSGGHYLAKRSAVFINGPWYIGRVRGDAPEVHSATRLTPAPAAPGGSYGHQIGFPLSNLAAANTDDPARREAVLAFMQWMTEPDNVARLSRDSGSLFAVKIEVDTSGIDPLQAQFIKASSEASFIVPHFQSQYPADLVAELGQGFGAMALGSISPQEFVQMLRDLNN